ncbi:MAG TPA: hypothetical protein VJR90_08260 [Gammaproteobacteria bacterium]|nr:hypothetical protein [Gammaproteobacteria bacterium]
MDYDHFHMKKYFVSDGSCVICGRSLKGRQNKYCSRKCKNSDTNNRHQNYVCQQARGLGRKLALIAERGGRCQRCGYNKNYAALAWHHKNPAEKQMELDLRAMSNRSGKALRKEIAKCELLCANCHAEIHHPECTLTGNSNGKAKAV